jgi:hypothetical protein
MARIGMLIPRMGNVVHSGWERFMPRKLLSIGMSEVRLKRGMMFSSQG